MNQKRYRECMAEIVGVLKKYDMAGAITVVDESRCMFKYHFPTWAAIIVNEKEVRIRALRKDFPNPEAHHRALEMSAHIIMQMRDVAANTFAMMEHLGNIMRKRVGMEHTPGVDFDPEVDN